MTSAIDNQHRPDDLKPLASLAGGMTGADIERLVRDVRSACRRKGVPLTWGLLEAALRGSRPTPQGKLALAVAVHEIGHALAYELLGIGSVGGVQIGGERGGETHVKLHVDQVQDERGITRLIATVLAGRAAEKLIFVDVMIGSGGADDSDLAKATSLALGAETSFGVAEDMPLLYRPPVQSAEALLYNPVLAERVNKRLEAGEAIAMDLLKGHLKLLPRLAVLLVDRTVLDGDEIRAAIEQSMSPPTI